MTITRSALAVLAIPAFLTACVQPDAQPLPEDFVPGADYNASPEECAAKGGKMTTDGNGLPFCYQPS